MAPDGVQQFVAADHGRGHFDQVAKHGEGLRPQVYRPFRPGHCLLISIDFELVELDSHSLSPFPACAWFPAMKVSILVGQYAKACHHSADLSCDGGCCCHLFCEQGRTFTQISTCFQARKRRKVHCFVQIQVVATERTKHLQDYQPKKQEPSIIVPAGALLIGLILLGLTAWPHWYHDQGSYSVPVRALVVESSRLPVARTVDRVWPRHSFAYHYLYQGELYVGRVYRLSGGQREAVRRYPVGSMVTAWIDPALPERSVIETHMPITDRLWLLLGIVLVATGLVRWFQVMCSDSEAFRTDGQHTDA